MYLITLHSSDIAWFVGISDCNELILQVVVGEEKTLLQVMLPYLKVDKEA